MSRQSRPLVKICGLSRAQDVALSVDLGAWAVGFVFAPSPRQVTAEAARELARQARATACEHGRERRPLVVGVFGDAPASDIAETAVVVGLDVVQLHGSRYAAGNVRRALTEAGALVSIVQAIPVAPEGTSIGALREAVAMAGQGADFLLFDTKSGSRWGGSGSAFPWSMASEAAGERPYLIAGGISPDNARQALELSAAWGIDVSSGVEQSPGIKDELRLRALFAAVDDRPLAGPEHQEPLEGSAS